MYDYDDEQEDKELKKVGLELMFMTPEKCNSDKGVTAVELAKIYDGDDAPAFINGIVNAVAKSL